MYNKTSCIKHSVVAVFQYELNKAALLPRQPFVEKDRPDFERKSPKNVDRVPTGRYGFISDTKSASQHRLTRMTTLTQTDPHLAEILHILDAWTGALLAKDIEAIMELYADDVRVFDAIPPHETTTAAQYRETWAMCLPCFPDSFDLTVHDRRVEVSGDLAFTHCLYRINGMEGDNPAFRTFLRATNCLRRQNGAWKIVHEHTSVPFNPYTNEASFILDPNDTTALESCKA